MLDVESRIWNAEWGIGLRNAECGMLNEFAEEMDQFRFAPPPPKPTLTLISRLGQNVDLGEG